MVKSRLIASVRPRSSLSGFERQDYSMLSSASVFAKQLPFHNVVPSAEQMFLFKRFLEVSIGFFMPFFPSRLHIDAVCIVRLFSCFFSSSILAWTILKWQYFWIFTWISKTTDQICVSCHCRLVLSSKQASKELQIAHFLINL